MAKKLAESPAQSQQSNLAEQEIKDIPTLPINSLNQATPQPAPTADPADEAELASSTQFYGKGDKKKQYPIDNTNKKHIVVRQVSVKQDNGGMYEVPNTEAVQAYHPEVFERMEKDNFFSQSNLKYDILHDPRK